MTDEHKLKVVENEAPGDKGKSIPDELPGGVVVRHAPSTNHATPDDPWIRDISVKDFAIALKNDAVAEELCEGERIHCEYCGEGFPMWPVRQWASHVVHTHHDQLTDQQIGAIAQFIAVGLTQVLAQWLAMQFLQRVALRRRARDMGLIAAVPGKIIQN